MSNPCHDLSGIWLLSRERENRRLTHQLSHRISLYVSILSCGSKGGLNGFSARIMVGIQSPAAMREAALVALAVRTEMIITKAYDDTGWLVWRRDLYEDASGRAP